MSPDGRGPRACDAPGHPPFAPRRDRRPPDALLSPSPVLSAAGVKPLMPLSGSPGGRVHVCVCVPIVAVCPMRAALLGVACLRVFVWPLSVSLVGFGVWYAVEVRSAGYRERCAGACRCVYYCMCKVGSREALERSGDGLENIFGVLGASALVEACECLWSPCQGAQPG